MLSGIDPRDMQVEDIQLDLVEFGKEMGDKNLIVLEPDQMYIHQITITKPLQTPVKTRALFVPGFAASSGCYLHVLKTLQDLYDEVTCMDPLGFGGSGRPTYKAYEP